MKLLRDFVFVPLTLVGAGFFPCVWLLDTSPYLIVVCMLYVCLLSLGWYLLGWYIGRHTTISHKKRELRLLSLKETSKKTRELLHV